MEGVHDLGGVHGFGPVVPTPADDRPFKAEWQRRIFGIALALTGNVVVKMHEIRYARERMEPAAYLASDYFEQWLASVETCLAESRLVSFAEVDEAAARIRGGEAAQPAAERPELTGRLRAGIFDRPTGTTETVSGRFEVGASVKAVTARPVGHTRLPGYVRGRTGRVVRRLAASALPDRSAHDEGDEPHAAYQVEFDLGDVWGTEADQNATIRLDVWDDYLETFPSEDRT